MKKENILRCTATTILCLSVACMICSMLIDRVNTDNLAPLIFILAILVIARLTEGYVHGIVAAIISVFIVNYAFTSPYMVLDFNLTGYPITFITFTAVSILVSALTTQKKRKNQMEIDAEIEGLRINLLRSVSHDFRTPLTVIIGLASAFSDKIELSEEKKAKFAKDIKDEAEWLLRVLDNIISITKLNGEAKIKKSPEMVEEIIGETVTKMKKKYPDVGISVDIPKDVMIVPMDALLIEQVLMNLIVNSINHGVYTTCVCLRVRNNGNMAVFSVTDNGVGFEEGQLAAVSKGRFQHGCADHSDNGGLGIGLTVCNSIVKAHGGKMTAKNLCGGAEVSFELPMT